MTTLSTLTIDQVDALCVEAAAAGDAIIVRDCQRAAYWLRSGASAMGVRSRAAARVARVITDAEAMDDDMETGGAR